MTRRIGLVLLAIVGCTPAAPRPAPPERAVAVPEPPAQPDSGAAPPAADAGNQQEAELDWLRQRVPNLRELRHGSNVSELFAWVGAQRTLWLTGGKYRCARTEAQRGAEDDLVSLEILDSERTVKGQRERTLVGGYAGHLLRYGSSGHTERQQADGSWKGDGGWGSSGGTMVGALSGLGEDAASYSGRPVFLQARCPRVSLGCADGGTRPCRDCSAFEVVLHPMIVEGGYGIIGEKLPKTCNEPCPASDTTDLDRARGILERLRDPWLPEDERSDVGLFRSLEACQRALPKP